MFQHILVPLDGSARAEQALPVAARIACASSGSILLLQVVNPPLEYVGGLASGPIITEHSIELDYEEATRYLKTVATSEVLAGVPTLTEVLFGSPAQNILAYVSEPEIDLIVLCSHGRTGFKQWVLGSIAHRIVHQSTVPVLVLNEQEPVESLSRSDARLPFCAFVPLDGSPLAERAILPAAHLAVALSAPARGAVHFAKVIKLYPATTTGSFVDEFNKRTLENARAYLVQLVTHLQTTMKDPKLSFRWSIACENGDADVATTLLNMAEHGEQRRPYSSGMRIKQYPLQCLTCREPIEPRIAKCPQHGEYRRTRGQVMTCTDLFIIHKRPDFERTEIGNHIPFARSVCWHTIPALAIHRARPLPYFLAKAFISPQHRDQTCHGITSFLSLHNLETGSFTSRYAFKGRPCVKEEAS